MSFVVAVVCYLSAADCHIVATFHGLLCKLHWQAARTKFFYVLFTLYVLNLNWML